MVLWSKYLYNQATRSKKWVCCKCFTRLLFYVVGVVNRQHIKYVTVQRVGSKALSSLDWTLAEGTHNNWPSSSVDNKKWKKQTIMWLWAFHSFPQKVEHQQGCVEMLSHPTSLRTLPNLPVFVQKVTESAYEHLLIPAEINVLRLICLIQASCFPSGL